MEVLRHPNPVLKNRAREVDPRSDAGLKDFVRAMAETMYAENGVGLAAPQVGIDKRVIVFDVHDRLGALCNPVLTEMSEELVIDEEGCLSVPGVNVPVPRSRRVVCEGLTIEGRRVRLEAEDLLARVLQHEIDHLDGVLILDRAPAEVRGSIIRAYNEANNL